MTTGPSPQSRKWLFRLVLLAAMAATIEASAWAILVSMKHLAPTYCRLSQSELRKTFRQAIAGHEERGYDALLGWDYQPGTAIEEPEPAWNMGIDADGGRLNALFADAEPIGAAYGDSFTAGVEVENDQTWPYFLSQRLGGLIANYGVGGYGTDQALLKFKVKHADRPAPALVVLAIYQENINRIFNRYRPYYSPGTGVRLGFKPRFVLDGQALRLIPNPMQQLPRSQTEFLALARSAGDGDLWYVGRVDCTLPATVNLARLVTRVLLSEIGIDRNQYGITPEKLWRDPDSTALMRAIIDDFIATATARGARPVVLFIPGVRPSWVDESKRKPPYAGVVKQLREDYAGQPVLVVDVAEAAFDAKRFNLRSFTGHASPYGNEIIAGHLAAALRAH